MSKAYDNGYQDGYNGKCGRNPHEEGSIEFIEYHQGWEMGDEEFCTEQDEKYDDFDENDFDEDFEEDNWDDEKEDEWEDEQYETTSDLDDVY